MSGPTPMPPPNPAVSPQVIAGRVKAPAILLIVVGVVNLLWGANVTIKNAIRFSEPRVVEEEVHEEKPEYDTEFAQGLDRSLVDPLRNFTEMLGPYEHEVNLGVSLLVLLFGVLITAGGVQMLRLRSYGLAITAAVLSCIPCFTLLACCGVGEGIGIYAFVVLMNKDVRGLF